MPVHTQHPDVLTHGLDDDCPRCEEIAERPIKELDRTNLRRIMLIATDKNRLAANALYTTNDLIASAKVLTLMEQAGHLAETGPGLLFEYLKRWGVEVTSYKLEPWLDRAESDAF